MAKFHVNKAGDPGRCRAILGQCPFGGSESHYTNKDDARKAFELGQEELLSNAKNGTESDLIEAKITPMVSYQGTKPKDSQGMQSLNSAIVQYSYENDSWDEKNDVELYARSQKNIRSIVGANFDLTVLQTEDFVNEVMEKATEGFNSELYR